MNTKESYIQYVRETLQKLDPKICKASYNTGFGIHIVDEHLGQEPMTIFVVQHSLAKIVPPKLEGDAWDDAWTEGKKMINDFIGGASG